MAREYAKVGTGIWSEASIQELTGPEQRAYLLVYTQPELSRCGVLPYTLRRWARLAKGETPTKLRVALRGLETRAHVLIDEDTEELLVRTYVRHDGLLSQPQVVGAMVRDYRSIRSARLRIAFLAELRRVWHLPLDEAERRGVRIALGVTETEKQRESVGQGLGQAMSAAIQEGLVEAFGQGSVQGLPEGLGKALARPSYSAPTPYSAPFSGSDLGQVEKEVEVPARANEDQARAEQLVALERFMAAS